jgi:hypothetical protein
MICSHVLYSKHKITIFPVLKRIKHYAMKTYEALVGAEWSGSHPGCLTPRKELLDLIGWIPVPAWMLWRRENCIVSSRNETSALSMNLVSISTELSQLRVKD